MGTVVKDEAAILKTLEKKPRGIRSTDLWFAVRGSVRSLTTFQKRLKHLEQKGRVEMSPDLDDMRATIIKPTETSAEAGHILEAIDTLEKLYLTRLPRKVLRVRKAHPDSPMENEMQEIGSGAANLLLIAHQTFLKSPGGQFGDPHVWLRVEQGAENEVHIRWLTLSEQQELEQKIEDLHKRLEVLLNFVERGISLFERAKASLPGEIADEWKQILASFHAEHGETIPS